MPPGAAPPVLGLRPPHPCYSGVVYLHSTAASQFRAKPKSFAPPSHARRPSAAAVIHASAPDSSFLASPTPPRPSAQEPPSTVCHAGRSKKKKNPQGGRIEGPGDVRRQAKAKARIRSRRLGESAFYRRKRRAAAPGQADAFTDAELEMIGMGYDRAVRFMDGPDDPRLHHPHDWYKYGRYGPYHWRGIVVGPPIRGRFSDDRVSLMSEVDDHEEWDRIEQFEMCNQFSNRLNDIGDAVGFRYYWVFVRHPKWRPDEKPWEQWTLSAEVAVEATRHQWLDKWSLMGRFGNPTRELITRCAAWTRPDIIYVKRPLYQSRFEPQEDFFSKLRPLVDPATENDFLFDLELDGQVIRTTYFAGLCRIVKANPKAYVDDVVNAYSRLSDADKSRCLEFLLMNHPMELLHPYTKEWKVKLEEMELGCDAPDESDDEVGDDEVGDDDGNDIVDWIEDDEADEGTIDEDDDYEEEEEEEEELKAEEVGDKEDSERYWEDQWKKAMRSSDKMEKLVKKSIQSSNEYNKHQMQLQEEMEQKMSSANTMVMDQEQTDEDEDYETARVEVEDEKQSSKNPGGFLRAAVRPFTYRNLVKEIVLMRHHIIDGEIDSLVSK
ncbi:hypothetical protein PR202_gb15153 [Eleusine coracana subsp. coracana]|uniref:Uncharacterized protein n=1 Tax=Eleusine coracana subsp. coracana TaxID=191504 RepID=A0AAV5EXM1_ELECO|nr:hypothetical protein QOZ80_4AG0311950 [Eleusine coracana subsp. coracana]GJN27157.1 hypothetical protein PR202_gb15153 [Eleusine coracana subsp. coracana]